MVKTLEAMLAKGKTIAATMLEAGEGDIDFKNGAFDVVGTDRRSHAVRRRRRATEMKKKGEIAEDLDTKIHTETPLTFPNGCHIAEVEIDPETGHMYHRHLHRDRRLRPRARPHHRRGPVARLGRRGLGQALMENTVYDAGSGQLVTGSFMDYAMPRAEDMPPLRDALYDVPATTNPLGVKGVGEAGTTAAISAVMNAVADAIPGGAGNHLDMPASAQRLWEACQRAKQ